MPADSSSCSELVRSDITKLTVKQDRNASQIEALVETSRNQLAAIIGNGRRLERLEQQAG